MPIPAQPSIPTQSKYELHGDRIRNLVQNDLNPQNEKWSLLYRHQLEALRATQLYYEGPEQPMHPALIVAPTGAGKSGIITLLPYMLKSSKALILSPSIKITDQLEKDFGMKNNTVKDSFVYKAGILQLDKELKQFLEVGSVMRNTIQTENMDWANLCIVNAQKFRTNAAGGKSEEPSTTNSEDEEAKEIHNDVMEVIETYKTNFQSFSTLVVDEAHHYPARTWDFIVENFKDKQIIFLTATPYRGREGLELWKGQRVTYEIDIPTLIRLNILRPLQFIEMDDDYLSDDKEKPTKEQYEKIRELILKYLREDDEKVPNVKHKAMILVSNIQEAKYGASCIRDGISVTYTSEDGSGNLTMFESANSKVKILFVCGRLLEGYDYSPISCCVILRNVGVPGLFTQYVGRCVRTTAKDGTDTVEAKVISHRKFNQRNMYDIYKAKNRITE